MSVVAEASDLPLHPGMDLRLREKISLSLFEKRFESFVQVIDGFNLAYSALRRLRDGEGRRS